MEATAGTLLRDLTTLRLGGPARTLLAARREDEVVDAVRDADRAGEPLLVLGGGSNVVVADSGFAGTVVRVATRGVERRSLGEDRVIVDAQAGEDWEALVAACVADGLAGIECLSGIPGSVGATPIQNVGAYGQEVRETIVAVRAYDRARDALVELRPEECGFGYRTSAFKRAPERWVVLSVALALRRAALSVPIRYAELARALGVEPDGRAPVEDVRAAVLGLRRTKGMVLDPEDPDTFSAGSFFTNPVLRADALAGIERHAGAPPPAWPTGDRQVKTSAAWLIERAGFRRGHGDPHGIAISSKHTLALTNRGAGTTADLLALAAEIAAGVREAFGVSLVPEPVLVGTTWDAVERSRP